MSYGIDAFTDGYGDYKQPTVIDYDKKLNNTYGGKKPYDYSSEEKEEILKQYQLDQENALKEILETNPVFAGDFYSHLVLAEAGKLIWNLKKIDELKSNVDWLYEFRRYLDRKKDEFYTK